MADDKGLRVLVANDERDICDTVEDILKGENFAVIKAYDGVEALKVIDNSRPHLVIVDVALPGVYGFIVCEYVKNKPELKGTKVILLTTLFDEKRYTRLPTSLYGADDYVEKRHIKEELLPKVRRVLNLKEPLGAIEVPVMEAHLPATVAKTVLPRTAVTEDAGKEQDAHEKARRLARIVVSDIVLYTEEKLNEAIKSGNIYTVLKDDIRDGIRFLRRRVPPSIPAEKYLKEAFEEFLAKKKKEMGLT